MKSFFVFFSILLSFSILAKEPIRISTFQVNDDLTDIAKKVIKEAYTRIGEKVIFEYVPAERGIMMANEHAVDGELYRIEGLEKKYTNLMRIPVPICFGVLYAHSIKKKALTIQGWKDLKPYTISYRSGLKAIENNTIGFKTFPVASLEQALLMLSHDRVDIVIDTKDAVDITWKNISDDKIIRYMPPVDSMPLFHYINVNHSELYPKLTRVLKLMEKKGLIKKLNQIKKD